MVQRMVNEELPPINILDVEDRINTALNATLAMHDLLEGFLYAVGKAMPQFDEEANTNSYMIGHARDMVREAHDIFHEFLAEEFAKRKAGRS